jgi:hypothetical protein
MACVRIGEFWVLSTQRSGYCPKCFEISEVFQCRGGSKKAVGHFTYGVHSYRAEGFPIGFGEAVEYVRLSSNLNYRHAHRAYSSCLAPERGVPVMFHESLIYLYRSGMPQRIRWNDVW